VKYDLFVNLNVKGIAPLQIGVVYQKQGQTPLEALVNDEKEVSVQYSKFVKSIGCENFEESDVFNDVFQDVKIKWFLGVSMEPEMVRRYIGMRQNCPNIVFHHLIHYSR
jgi:hypothetical protein